MGFTAEVIKNPKHPRWVDKIIFENSYSKGKYFFEYDPQNIKKSAITGGGPDTEL